MYIYKLKFIYHSFTDYAIGKRDENSEIFHETVRRTQHCYERYSHDVCHFGILWVHTLW